MWCRGGQSPLLRCCIVQLGQLQNTTHHNQTSTETAESSRAPYLQLRMGHMLKQRVIKKVESARQGRLKLQVSPPPAAMQSQSVLLPGPNRIRASGATSDPTKVLETLADDVQTICDTLIRGQQKSSTGECLGYRSPPQTGKYKWISYSEVVNRKNDIGSGLLNLNLSQPSRAVVGICTKTRPEFLMTLMACSNYSMVFVPLYNCFGSEQLSYIINQVNMEVVICEDKQIAIEIIKNAEAYPKLQHIVIIDCSKSDLEDLKHSKFDVLSFKDLEASGKQHPVKPIKPKPDDLFCICYTSGTTGLPKGVMITHRNVLSCIGGVEAIIGDSIPSFSSLMCYLPCAHIYEMVNEIYCLYHGGRLGYFGGNVENLFNDIKELQPTILPLVPKLMNRIYSGVNKKIGANPLQKYVLGILLKAKQKALQRGIISKNTFGDKLLFSRVQKMLGGSLQIVLTSSAPVAEEVMQFFRCSMGCTVFEVYGLSEVGAATMTLISEHESGFVGPPLPCNHIRLESVPEMSYFAENDVGEICVRGANVFNGYFKNREQTEIAFDAEGWYHTGDIGKWLPNGTLTIIDRKKNIFKLSQGEYIVPDKTENAYIQSPIVAQVYVDGYSDKDFIVAIVVPDEPVFVAWAHEKGFKKDLVALCEDHDVKKEVLEHIWKLGKGKNLNSLHQVGNIHLSPEAFTQENGLLTPTLKLKRSDAKVRFAHIFHNLYWEGNLRLAQSSIAKKEKL